jgi:8-oxo-dGTP diphosphatase
MAHWQDRHSVVPAVYVLFRRGNEILLTRRANTGYRDGYYSLPAGHLDGGEPAIIAAIREVKEEVGVDIKPEDLKFIHVQHRVAEERDHERMNLFFETRTWRGEIINAEPHKCDDIRWVPLDALPDNVVSEVKEMLSRVSAGHAYGHYDFPKS